VEVGEKCFGDEEVVEALYGPSAAVDGDDTTTDGQPEGRTRAKHRRLREYLQSQYPPQPDV